MWHRHRHRHPCGCHSQNGHTHNLALHSLPADRKKALKPTLAVENVGTGLANQGFDVGWLDGTFQVASPDGRAPLSFFDSSLFTSPHKANNRARTASSVTFHSYKSRTDVRARQGWGPELRIQPRGSLY